jgi:enediyne biosynthesis protein E4
MTLSPFGDRRTLRFRRTVRFGLLLGFTLTLAACSKKSDTAATGLPGSGSGVAPGKTDAADEQEAWDGPAWFQDVTKESGIDFGYKNGEEAMHMAIIESLGGGCAAIDFDRDGKMDVWINGGGGYDKTAQEYVEFRDGKHVIKDGRYVVKGAAPKVLGRPGRLYRNLGNMKFEDVTKQSGLDAATAFTHGCAVADINRDGFPDLLTTGYNRLTMYLNVPDGKGGRKFEDITEKAKLTERLWSSSAAFADLDGDGFPDLYVCHYGDWGFESNHPADCTYDSKTYDVCPPKRFKSLQHSIYRNNGDGTFTDLTPQLAMKKDDKGRFVQDEKKRYMGLRDDGKGLNVIFADINDDGRPDIYVANDTDENFLYVNRGKPGEPIKLEEIGMLSGVARDYKAGTNGSMGLDAADILRNGKCGYFVTNYEQELHAMYINASSFNADSAKENLNFDYVSHRNGIQLLGPTMVGWGTAFLDLNRDGWEDLFIVHGHAIHFPPEKVGRKQLPKILLNQSKDELAKNPKSQGKFVRISNRGGEYFKTRHDSRGFAKADFDNDGRPDFVISHVNEPVTVLKNTAPTDNHWVGLELVGEKFRDVVGGKVVVVAGGETHTHFIKSGGSFASSNDPRIVIGLGQAKSVEKITVVWPYGKSQEWTGLDHNRYWKLTENAAKAE